MQLGLRDLPNAITIARIVSVIPLAWLLVEQRYQAALLLAVLAGASDGLDGLLAKRYNWVTRLGSLLDPIADKLLLGVCFTVLALQGHLPIWLLALVIGRDLVIIGGATAFHFLIRDLDGDPSLISKLNTMLQIVLVLLVLLTLALLWQLPATLTVLIYATAVTTVLSGLHYVWLGTVRARQLGRKGRKHAD